MTISRANLMFLKSTLCTEGRVTSTQDVRSWLDAHAERLSVAVTPTSFSALEHWDYDPITRNLRHSSGRFFTIDGIRVRTNWHGDETWEQPIINQPEIGYLGFVAREFDGVLHFLVQAKIEPGNINKVQISPTLQATRSNFTQVHGGRAPEYLEVFRNARPEQILLDQLQSEQGARFMRKRNRNMIVQVGDEVVAGEQFTWVTLGQLKELMRSDNVVNMDARTVISGIPFGLCSRETIELVNFVRPTSSTSLRARFLESALCEGGGKHELNELIQFLTHLKSVSELFIEPVDVKSLDGWTYTDQSISREDGKYFRVLPVDVSIDGREVSRWGQPMIQPSQEGLCAFVCKEIEGILHFAVQAKLECGNHDIIEFAPTVQCLTGNYRDTESGSLPFLEYVLAARADQIIVDTMQSEEGGRFYLEQNRNMIILAGDEVDEALPDRFMWMSLNQLFEFLRFNNFLNIQARSLIASISFA